MKKLKNKVALITGGARGMGRTTALKLASEGADVAILDIAKPITSVPYEMSTQNNLEDTVSAIKGKGVKCIGINADVRNSNQISEAVKKVVNEFGKIDILVTSAGVLSYGYVWELTEEQWDHMIDINLKGTWMISKYVVPEMINQKSGKIICISSVNGLRGGTKVSHYVASKHGVLGFVKSLAMEVGPYNIHVNAVCPTAVDTEMANNQETYDRLAGKKGAIKEEATPTFSNHHVFPNEGFISVESVANTILFLASDDSNNITGHHIAVDAGYLTM